MYMISILYDQIVYEGYNGHDTLAILDTGTLGNLLDIVPIK